jgi:uncharacterized protein involved in exopolysaccharide biosynthesis
MLERQNSNPGQGIPQGSSISLKSFVQVLFKRKNVILTFFITVVLLVTITSFQLSPIYNSSGKLIVEREIDPEKAMLLRINLQQNMQNPDFINSEIEIIKSYVIASRVVDTLNLHLIDSSQKNLTDVEKKQKFERAIISFARNLKVENITKSNIIEISYESKYPKLAAKVVQAAIDIYIKYRSEMSNESEAFKFFEEQILISDQKINELEERQANFKQQKGVISPDAQQTMLMGRMADYDKSLTVVRSKRIGKEAKLNTIKEQLAKGGDIIIPGTESSDSPSRVEYINKLKGHLLDMEIQREKLLQKFTPQYKEVLYLDEQIASTKEKISTEIGQIVQLEETAIKALRAEEQGLLNSISEIENEIQELAQKEYEYSKLSRGINDNREIYSMLLKQREDARISLARLEKGVKITVVSPPTVPFEPSKPNKALNIILAIILGLFGGLGLAFMMDYFDHTVDTPEELERYAGIPVLGSIRDIKTLSNHHNDKGKLKTKFH